MHSQERGKLPLKDGMNSPTMNQNNLRVERIYFPVVWTFYFRSKWRLIFLSRPITCCTNKMNYSVYSNNKKQACCHLATPGRKGIKIWKKSIFFSCRNSIICYYFRTMRSNEITHCSSFHLLRPEAEILQEYSTSYGNTANLGHFLQRSSQIQEDCNNFQGIL